MISQNIGNTSFLPVPPKLADWMGDVYANVVWVWQCVTDDFILLLLRCDLGAHMWVLLAHLCSEKDSFTNSRRQMYYLIFSSLLGDNNSNNNRGIHTYFYHKAPYKLYTELNPSNVTSIHGMKCNSSFNNAHPRYYCLEY